MLAAQTLHTHPCTHTLSCTHTEIKTDTQTQIFPLTAADASRHVFTFPPWFNSATATGHQLIVSLSLCVCVFMCLFVCLCVDYMVLSKLLRNIQHLRLRASARVCVHNNNQSWVSAQAGFCGVCSSLPSRELSTLRCSHWRPACARSAVIAPFPCTSCLSSQIRDISVLQLLKRSQIPPPKRSHLNFYLFIKQEKKENSPD